MPNPMFSSSLTPAGVDALYGQYQTMSPMLEPTEDPGFMSERQAAYMRNQALQNNQAEPLRIDVGTSPVPENVMMNAPMETMTMPQSNAMLTQPNNLMEAAAQQFAAEPNQNPFGDYVKSNWQGLLSQGIAGLQDNAMRENLPADTYIKLKGMENDKAIAEQDRLLSNLKLEADLEYQKQSLELKREELAMERQKVLSGGSGSSYMEDARLLMRGDPSLGLMDAYSLTRSGLPRGVVYNPALGGVQEIQGFSDVTSQIGAKEKSAEARAGEIGKEMGVAEAKLNAMESSMPTLENVTGRLSKLGKIATYTQAGQVRDTALRELGMDIPDAAVARTEYISTVDNEVLPLMRQTFGAAFTAEEGNRLRVTLGDPDKTPDEKDAVLRSFISAKKGEIDSLKRQTGKEVSPQSTQSTTTRLKFNPATGDFE